MGVRGRLVGRLPPSLATWLTAARYGQTDLQRALGDVTQAARAAVLRSRRPRDPEVQPDPNSLRADPHLPPARALTQVRTALATAGVAYVVLPQYAARVRRLVVAQEDRRAALRALRDAADLQGWWIRRPGERPGRALPVADLPTGGRAAVYRVSRPRAARSGPVDERDVVDLEFWSRVPAAGAVGFDGARMPSGVLVAPRSNRVADRLSPERVLSSQRTDEHWSPAQGAALPHLFEITDPIDVVYTWVDGSDPAWRERMERARHPDQDRNLTATADSRFLSRDELRYSLRSLEQYAGWVRHVYLVTDGQVPAWLRLDHPNLTVVDHTEIFSDPGALPVFNSHAIESQLHHIPGLSERYLYLNDDVFFGRPTSPDMFFHANGLSQFFCSAALIGLDAPDRDDLPLVAATKRNRELIQRNFGVTITHRLKHTPHPQQRRVLLEMEERFSDEFDRVMRSRFRHPDDVSVAAGLHHWYAYARGLAVPGEIQYAYIDLARWDAAMRLEALLGARNQDTFCLNDTRSDGALLERVERLVSRFCQRYFPIPSSFERDR